MGFNKRCVNLKNLLLRYQEDNSLESIKTYLDADALIVNMDSSRYIVNKICQGDDNGAKLILEYELSRQGLS